MVFVLGHPAYYSRFGFESASLGGLTCQWEVPEKEWVGNRQKDTVSETDKGIFHAACPGGRPPVCWSRMRWGYPFTSPPSQPRPHPALQTGMALGTRCDKVRSKH